MQKRALAYNKTEEGKAAAKHRNALYRSQNIDYRRNYRLKQEYGITQEQFLGLLSSQNGLCAICEAVPSKGKLVIDHCHESGKVRGLLCTRCNIVLGQIERNRALIFGMLAYIEAHK